MSIEQLAPQERFNPVVAQELVTAYTRGNVLLPQTNLGVVTYVGERMLAQTEHSLLDLTTFEPDTGHLAQMTAAMNTTHVRHGIPELGADRLKSVFTASLGIAMHEFGTMVGITTVPPTRLSQGVVSDKLGPEKPARQVVSGVFSFVKDQFANEAVREQAQLWRTAVSQGQADRERNVHLRALADHLHEAWNAQERPFALPLQYTEVYGFDDRVRGLIVYTRLPDEILGV